MKIEKPGEYRMRNGLRAWVRFRRLGYDGPYPWVGERELPDGSCEIESWNDYGRQGLHTDSPLDLMPPEEVRYCNVYLDNGTLDCCPFHKSIESAKLSMEADCIGIIKLTTCGDQKKIEVISNGINK